MTYQEYLKFYGLKENKETHTDWLHNEWHHGRAYQYEGEFFSVTTGAKLEQIDAKQVKETIKIGNTQINHEKLKEYLDQEMILAFNSPEECMEYFNTYDSQNFKTVEEMKQFQGEYGFGLDGKWYHISFDEALDVKETPVMANLNEMQSFVSEQIYVLYDTKVCSEEEMEYADSRLEDITQKYLAGCDAWEAENDKDIPLSIELEIMHRIILNTIKERDAQEHSKPSLNSILSDAQKRATKKPPFDGEFDQPQREIPNTYKEPTR